MPKRLLDNNVDLSVSLDSNTEIEANTNGVNDIVELSNSKRKRKRRTTPRTEQGNESTIDESAIRDSTEENTDLEHLLENGKDSSTIAEHCMLQHQPFICRTKESLPEKLQHYWLQRYWFWSLYDHGIMMDTEGWYSVTPEKIARHIAERCRTDIIIDAFCGVGGNAIQFAFTCERVIAIDIDANRLQCAKHNARVYGVEDRIEFIHGNYMELAGSLKADVVFLSPPWGGPSYKASSAFDIDTMMPMNGTDLFRKSRKITRNIAYFLPKNTRLDQLASLSEPNEICEVEQALLRRRMKAITVYYGDLAYVDDTEEYAEN